MIWATVVGALAKLLGRLLPFLAAWGLGKRDASQRAEIERLRADEAARAKREGIEDDIAQDTDLADRARSSGVVRKPGQ